MTGVLTRSSNPDRIPDAAPVMPRAAEKRVPARSLLTCPRKTI